MDAEKTFVASMRIKVTVAETFAEFGTSAIHWAKT